MTRPQAIVFDLGKVLVDFDYRIAAQKIAAHSGVTPERIREFIGITPLLIRYETGLMTSEEFFAEVRSATGFRGSLDEFAAIFGDIFTPIPPMIELQAELRRRGFPTFVFSNTNAFAINHITRTYPFFTNFDGYIYSYEHRAMKPQPELYAVVEKMTGRKGAEILYLDDRAENVDGGAARGWQVILQETPEKTLAALRGSGILS